MKLEKYPWLQIGVKWGGILALGVILLTLINYVIGYDNLNGAVMWMTQIAWWGFVVFCLVKSNLEYRNQYLDGQLKYGQAFSVGLIVNILSNTLFSVFYYLFYEFVDKETFEKSILKGIEMIENNAQIPDEMKEEMVLNLIGKTSLSSAIEYWWSSILIFAFFMVFIAIFTKKKNNSFQETFKDVE
ncbi:MAG: DUF4199 domain-containing protein [Bacteroidales bacterium]|nr:DUF4199 domain-containing protein [Bacteroidales bacterium]